MSLISSIRHMWNTNRLLSFSSNQRISKQWMLLFVQVCSFYHFLCCVDGTRSRWKHTASTKRQYLNSALSMYSIAIGGQHEFFRFYLFFQIHCCNGLLSKWCCFFVFRIIRRKNAIAKQSRWIASCSTMLCLQLQWESIVIGWYCTAFFRCLRFATNECKVCISFHHSTFYLMDASVVSVDDINHTAWMQSIFNKSIRNPFISIDRQSFITQLHRIFMNEPPGDK